MLSLLSCTCFAQENWDLKKDENGIAVYTRKLDNEKYKEIRVICEFKATVKELINVLQDVNNHKDWVYKTTKSWLIKKVNEDTLFYYSEISLPWPASNRDAVVRFAVSDDSANRKTTITIKSFPDLIPKKPNLVRVPYSLGQYDIISLPGNHIKIDYTLSVSPGGSLPAWLVNYTATIGPYNTFLSLKKLVEK